MHDKVVVEQRHVSVLPLELHGRFFTQLVRIREGLAIQAAAVAEYKVVIQVLHSKPSHVEATPSQR